jgi:hypothetical protein
MHARAWKCLFVTAVCVAAAAGCKGETARVVAASQNLAGELAKADSVGRAAPPAHGARPNGGETRLYVDASRSMAGFVGCGGTPTVFDQVMDRMANDLEITGVRLFGSQAGGGSLVEERPLDRSVHCPDAFRRLQNPDYELYALLERDSTAPVNLYFTDGVQSATTHATPSPSVAALQRWLAGGQALAILVFRSRFAGDAWSEQRDGWMGRVDVPDRPFYVFVLAPTEDAIDQTLARLSPSLQPSLTLRFPAAPFSCGIRRTIGAQQVTDSPLWALVPPSAHLQMVGKPIPVADYVCTIRNGYPLRTVEATLRADYRMWDGQSFGNATPLPGNASLTVQPPAATADGSVAVVAGTVPRDQPATLFGFYHVRLSPRPGALRTEMDSLSTDSDVEPAQFNRTYRFSWLVEHLVRGQFARGPHPASLFLTIQDGG